MEKTKADMIQLVVIVIAITLIAISSAWAVAWRANERDRINAEARIEAECYVSGSDLLDSGYSVTITCRLPQGGE